MSGAGEVSDALTAGACTCLSESYANMFVMDIRDVVAEGSLQKEHHPHPSTKIIYHTANIRDRSRHLMLMLASANPRRSGGRVYVSGPWAQ
jgi:hypothetical protein